MWLGELLSGYIKTFIAVVVDVLQAEGYSSRA
jgi:hypothetical protein